MRPMTAEALKRKAISMGAKLETSGKVFNAGRSVALVKPIEAPKPAEKSAEPPKEDKTLLAVQNIANATMAVSEVSVAIIQHLQEQAQKSPKKWLFTMTRDGKGNLVSIEATAKE